MLGEKLLALLARLLVFSSSAQRWILLSGKELLLLVLEYGSMSPRPLLEEVATVVAVSKLVDENLEKRLDAPVEEEREEVNPDGNLDVPSLAGIRPFVLKGVILTTKH